MRAGGWIQGKRTQKVNNFSLAKTQKSPWPCLQFCPWRPEIPEALKPRCLWFCPSQRPVRQKWGRGAWGHVWFPGNHSRGRDWDSEASGHLVSGSQTQPFILLYASFHLGKIYELCGLSGVHSWYAASLFFFLSSNNHIMKHFTLKLIFCGLWILSFKRTRQESKTNWVSGSLVSLWVAVTLMSTLSSPKAKSSSLVLKDTPTFTIPIA